MVLGVMFNVDNPACICTLFARRRRGGELLVAADGGRDIGEGRRLQPCGGNPEGSGDDVKWN
jgi:hypothetical protein